MQNVNYRNSIPSPFQTRQKIDPVQEAIDRNIGKFSLEISIEEDKETARELKEFGPVIAYKCTTRKGSQVLGIGRGSNILSQVNKWVEKSTRYTLNSSIIDSIIQSVKALDVIYLKNSGIEIEPATDKQKSYIRELLNANISNREERNQKELQLLNLSKDQASEMIQNLINH